MEVNGQLHASAALPGETTWYPLDKLKIVAWFTFSFR